MKMSDVPTATTTKDDVEEIRRQNADAAIKRSIVIVPPENAKGNIEYKRQILHSTTSSRLRSLSTQMSYRLDEGKGICIYRIGVEDDGCHSMLDYNSITESIRVLECIAHNMNAIIIERKMIQNEITITTTTNKTTTATTTTTTTKRSSTASATALTASGGGGKQRRGKIILNNVIRIDGEPVIFYEGSILDVHNTSNDDEQQHAMMMLLTHQQRISYTRAEVTIQRIETHVLGHGDVPLTLSELIFATTGSIPKQRSMNRSDILMNGVGSSSSSGSSAISSSKKDNSSGGGSGVGTSPTITSATNKIAPSSSLPTNNNNTRPKETTTTTATPGKIGNGGGGGRIGTGKTSSSLHSDTGTSSTIGETLSSRNIRVAVVGNVDAGKSTLIGTLTTSCLDDGRGRSRTVIMKHRHEIESGRTSTATTHLMGFRYNGEVIAGKDTIRGGPNKRKSEDEIAKESYRIITLMDLAGHEKYLKTTIHGVSSGFADYAMILVNSRQPPTHMTQHHLNLCCSFGIPIIVIFTKIDGCPQHAYKTCKQEVIKMLRSPEISKKPFTIRNNDDITTVMDKLHILAPMIDTSCVNGDGISLLHKILFSLPKRRRHENKITRKFEFLIEDIFNNVPGVGSVVSGFVNSGELTVGSNCHVYVGPTDDGNFIKTVAKSAHIARINTTHITSGQSACLAFSLNKELRKKLRRGMVVLQETNPTSSTKQFDAEICVLKGEGTTIRRSYQAYVHILNVRQSAYARNIEIVNNNAAGLPPSHAASIHDDADDDDANGNGGNGNNNIGGIVLRPGSRAKVRFEFAKRPEYIRPGMRMLFRDGRVRGVGIITAVPSPETTNITSSNSNSHHNNHHQQQHGGGGTHHNNNKTIVLVK